MGNRLVRMTSGNSDPFRLTACVSVSTSKLSSLLMSMQTPLSLSAEVSSTKTGRSGFVLYTLVKISMRYSVAVTMERKQMGVLPESPTVADSMVASLDSLLESLDCLNRLMAPRAKCLLILLRVSRQV